MVKRAEKTRESGMAALMASLKDNKDRDVYVASRLTDNWKYIDFRNPALKTPNLAMEYLFGSRGILCGRVMKLEAPYGVGKSSFMFYIYGCAQVGNNAWCYHAETEAAAPPPDFIAAFGVDTNNLLIEHPRSIEACIESIDDIVARIRGGFGGEMGETGRMKKTQYTDPLDPTNNAPIVIGVDSLSALGLDADVEVDILDLAGSPAIGKHARMIAKFFRDRTLRIKRTDTLLMIASQQKAKISTTSVPGQKTTTSLADTPVGFHSTYCLDLKALKYIDDLGNDIGERVIVRTTKNKVSPKHREITMYLVRNRGFDMTTTDVEFLLSHRDSPLAAVGVEAKRWQGGVICKALADERFKTEADFLQALYANTEILTRCRQHLRIRGFGFDFETSYVMSPAEIEDNTEAEDGVAGSQK